MEAILQLDHTAHTTRYNALNIYSLNVFELMVQDLSGKVVVNKIKASTHTATTIRLLHLHKLDSRQRAEELPRLLRDLHPSSEVAWIVIRHPNSFALIRGTAATVRQVKNVQEKGRRLDNLLTKGLHLFIVGKELRIALLEEIETGGTRDDDLIRMGKGLDVPPGQGFSCFNVS
jgi:hypothetical protein